MRIITCNVNGIRSALSKGFWDWTRRQKPDVVCLQEVRADESQIPSVVKSPKNFHSYFFPAQKKGYSGVALLSRHKPDNVEYGMGWRDEEGRYLRADFGKLSVVSVYFPSGSSGDERQQIKYDFMDRFLEMAKNFRKMEREFIFCGDFNIAHKNIDLKNWRSNQKNSGFLPEERAWMDVLFDELGFVDAFRALRPQAEQYTWWSNRGRAYENNVGWRLDYHVVSPQLRNKLQATRIFRGKKFSDHAPLSLDYDLSLPKTPANDA